MFITSNPPAHRKGSAAVRQQEMLAFSLSLSSLEPDCADKPDVPATATLLRANCSELFQALKPV